MESKKKINSSLRLRRRRIRSKMIRETTYRWMKMPNLITIKLVIIKIKDNLKRRKGSRIIQWGVTPLPKTSYLSYKRLIHVTKTSNIEKISLLIKKLFKAKTRKFPLEKLRLIFMKTLLLMSLIRAILLPILQ